VSRLALLRPFKPGFPFSRPTLPAGAERLPARRNVGLDYDTTWARRYPARLVRAMVLDTVGVATMRALASPTVSGADRIEHLDAPAIFVANHSSHVDTPLLLTALPSRFRHRTAVAAAADYFFETRWKGTVWALLINAFPIERRRVSRGGTDTAARLVDEGWSLVVFPEGGRTPDGWARVHRPGAAYLGTRRGLPVVPVHLEGTRRILARGAQRLTPASTTVTFGRPLRAAEGEDPRAFAARVERAVSALADEQATDWWSARRRAAAGDTPSMAGPVAGAWRRTWALGGARRPRAADPHAAHGAGDGNGRRWPPL
jgi:1-acyl-sn-glycerol-3-phosphate acyltransferase